MYASYTARRNRLYMQQWMKFTKLALTERFEPNTNNKYLMIFINVSAKTGKIYYCINCGYPVRVTGRGIGEAVG